MGHTERTKAEQIANAYFDMGAGWAESGGLLRDLREMEQGYLKQLADAQATVEALQAQLAQQGEEVQRWKGKYDVAQTNAQTWLNKYQDMVAWYDKQNGTPCEQIRHQQQVEALQRERSKKQAEEAMVVFAQLSQLQALVRDFIEAWDHDGEPNAVAYEGVVARARATLDATTLAKFTKEELSKWWHAQCPQCGWNGLSRDCAGGEPLADTGDFNDPMCPMCAQTGRCVVVDDYVEPKGGDGE